MKQVNELTAILGNYLSMNKARLTLISMFIIGLIRSLTVNLVAVSKAMPGSAKKESKYRRIQRFFAKVHFNMRHVTQLIQLLLPQKTDFVLSMDRTQWQFGSFTINILMVAIVYQGIAFPIVWTLLPKKGNSNTKERIKIMKRVLRFIDGNTIKAILGDREFIGEKWFNWLKDHQIPFYFRIKHDAIIHRKGHGISAGKLFGSLAVGQSLILNKPVIVYGCRLHVAALRLNATELLIVATDQAPDTALETYRLRWEIETLFAALKSKGFNFEDTHLDRKDRIETLIAFLAIAFAWAHLTGEWLNQNYKPIAIKNHGYRAVSIFRYGLDHMQHMLHNIADKIKPFNLCLRILTQGLNAKSYAKIVV